MPEPTPYTTGGDILNYKGDAGLAAGAGTGGIMPQQGDPYAGISSALDQVNEQSARMAMLRYHQKIKQQDDLSAALAATGGSVFNMKGANGQNMSYSPLPDDQKILDEKAADLRRIMLSKPDSYDFDPTYRNKYAEYKSLANHAGVRAVAHSNFNLAAAQTNDPDERQEIIGQRQSEVNGHSLTDYHLPEPHLPKLQAVDTINPKDWEDKKKLQQFGSTIEQRDTPDGGKVDYEVKKMGIPNNVVLQPLNDVTPAGIANAKNAVNTWRTLPQAQNPAAITAMNLDIDQKAAARGIKPVYAATVNPDGTINYNPDPRQALTAFNIEKYGKLISDESPSKAPSEQKNIASEIQDRNARNRLATRAEAEKERHDLAMENKPQGTRTEQLKEEEQIHAAQIAYDTAQKVFGREVKGKALYPKFWHDRGIDPAKYNIDQLPEKTADKLIGVEAPVVKSEQKGQKSETPKGQSIKPSRSFIVENKDTGEKELVFLDAKNNIISRVTEKDAPANILKHDAKYDQKVYSNQILWVDKIAKRRTEPGPETTQNQDQNDEAAIQARLVPAQVKKPDGTLVDILYDPITKKRYAK